MKKKKNIDLKLFEYGEENKESELVLYFTKISGLGISGLAEVIEENREYLERALSTPIENLPDKLYDKLYPVRMLLHTALEFAHYSNEDLAKLLNESSSFDEYEVKPPWYPKSLIDDIRERHTNAMLDAVSWMHGFGIEDLESGQKKQRRN